MLTAGYEFYKGTYHGDRIAAAEWPALSRDAAACLEELTLGRTAGIPKPMLPAGGVPPAGAGMRPGCGWGIPA